MDNIEVLAVIEEKELKQIEDLKIRKVALKNMMADIEERYVQLAKDDEKVWESIREKYDLPKTNLNLNRTTREVTVRE